VERLEKMRQGVIVGVAQESEGRNATAQRGYRAECPVSTVGGRDGLLREGDELLAGAGEYQAARASDEQSDAVALFDPFDEFGDGRLRHAEVGRCGGERAQQRDSEEGSELVHRHRPTLWLTEDNLALCVASRADKLDT